jgi:predicted ribosomally synthesized peptide with nif11-like leader
MSKEDLKAFQQEVDQSPDLKKQLQAQTNKAEFIKLATTLGKKGGHDFTEKEVQEFIDGPDSPTRNLSDAQLESSVGRPEKYTYSKPGCNR